MNDEHISRIAYRLWQERGCPIGSPEVDWTHAEALFRAGEPAAQTAAGIEVALNRDVIPDGVPTLDAPVVISTDVTRQRVHGDSDLRGELPTLEDQADRHARTTSARNAKTQARPRSLQ
jgi:Protein of unknown function (DUF2934)